MDASGTTIHNLRITLQTLQSLAGDFDSSGHKHSIEFVAYLVYNKLNEKEKAQDKYPDFKLQDIIDALNR